MLQLTFGRLVGMILVGLVMAHKDIGRTLGMPVKL